MGGLVIGGVGDDSGGVGHDGRQGGLVGSGAGGRVGRRCVALEMSGWRCGGSCGNGGGKPLGGVGVVEIMVAVKFLDNSSTKETRVLMRRASGRSFLLASLLCASGLQLPFFDTNNRLQRSNAPPSHIRPKRTSRCMMESCACNLYLGLQMSMLCVIALQCC